MAKPRVLILRAPGTNCDKETQFAFELTGGLPERVHINRLRERPDLLHDFQILIVPGAFSYGDDVGAGKILANQLSVFLGDTLRRFRDEEKLILGICNGFQALLKAGLSMSAGSDLMFVEAVTGASRQNIRRGISIYCTPSALNTASTGSA
jgi:phosphoribosylformylglycinamidine synthase subunit PurQ / glutaminase